ncbi:MAG: sel1 repeat family protein [Spartobacteria bacterium]|nr:sel1 repeat family protein [Spartobacteria bacterium]
MYYKGATSSGWETLAAVGANKPVSGGQMNTDNHEREAKYWYEKAAHGGDSEAQYMLGQMYYEGKGCAQDLVAAYAWLYLA